MDNQTTQEIAEPESRLVPCLWVITGLDVGRHHALAAQCSMRLGSDPASDVFIDDPTVSRAHASLEWSTDDSVWIRDLGSTNGTWIGGQHRLLHRLVDGDRVRVGRTTLLFGHAETPPQPRAPRRWNCAGPVTFEIGHEPVLFVRPLVVRR